MGGGRDPPKMLCHPTPWFGCNRADTTKRHMMPDLVACENMHKNIRTVSAQSIAPLHCARYFSTRFPPKRPQTHPFQRPLNSGHLNYRS